MKYPLLGPNCQGAIYILTNPMFNAVKIGYATDVEKRRADLSRSTSIPLDFEVYAYYEVEKNCADKSLHSLISLINPELRVNPGKEFFNITPEDAYSVLQRISELSATESRLHLVNENDDLDIEPGEKEIRSSFRFDFAKIEPGSILKFDVDRATKAYGKIDEATEDLEATVFDNKRVLFAGNATTLSNSAKNILCNKFGCKNIYINGTDWWLYNGESLWKRRMKMEKNGNYGVIYDT